MIRRSTLPIILLFVGAVGGWFVVLEQPSVNLAGQEKPSATKVERVVYLAGGLSDEQVITLTAAVAASRRTGIVLLHSPESERPLKSFLAAFRPERLIAVGPFAGGIAELERRLETKTTATHDWPRGPPRALWKDLFPHAEQVVVCPAEPRSLLLQSACLAGSLRAPLFVSRGSEPERAELQHCLADWKTHTVYDR